MGGCSSSSKIIAGVSEPSKAKKAASFAKRQKGTVTELHEPGMGTPAPPIVKKNKSNPMSPKGGRGHIKFDDGSSNPAVEAAVMRSGEEDSVSLPGAVPQQEESSDNNAEEGSKNGGKVGGSTAASAPNAETASTIASIHGNAANDADTPSPPTTACAEATAGPGTALPDAVEAADIPAGLTASFSLLPLSVPSASVRETFEAYAKRIPEDLAKSFDCTFNGIEASLTASSAHLPHFLWLRRVSKNSSSDPDPKEPAPENSDGLVVFRTQRSFSGSFCEVLHFSLTTPSWRDDLGPAIQACTSFIFDTAPVSSVRAVLQYSVVEDGKFKILPDVERPFKSLGFRWSRLSNSSDGRRLQVVERTRSADRGDPKLPEELLDLKVASFLVLPLLDGARPASSSANGGEEEEEAQTSSFGGNCLLQAECLRRHALAEKDDPKPPGVNGEAAGGDSTSSVVEELYRKLKRHSTLQMVKSTAGTKASILAEEGGQFEGLADNAFPEDSAQALCGSFQLALNWRHSTISSAPGFLNVEIHATGGAADDVIFLETEDENIDVSIWKISEEIAGYTQDKLYRHCLEKIKSSPPTKVGDDRPFDIVKLPECKLSLAGSTSAPPDHLCSQAFGRPFHQLEVALSSRKPAPGVLIPSAPDSTKAFELDRPFLMCAWHDKIEDVEVPLFVAVIDPKAA